MGGWKPNEPIPAPHSDPSPQAAVTSSCRVGFTAATPAEACGSVRVQCYMIITQSAVRPGLAHHLFETVYVCVWVGMRGWPVIPNIAHPEYAYAEKPQSKKHKEET